MSGFFFFFPVLKVGGWGTLVGQCTTVNLGIVKSTSVDPGTDISVGSSADISAGPSTDISVGPSTDATRSG